MLTHIINEPGPNNNNNNNTGVITLAERFNSVNYISCEMHLTSSGPLRSTGIEYMICRVNACKGRCLFDRGANGVICGDDVRCISMSDRTLNVTGIDNHEMRNLQIGTFGGVITTQAGDVIAIFNQCAYHPAGRSIISCLQVEDNGVRVDDRSISMGGTQCATTEEGYIIPFDCVEGLMYVTIRPFTDQEANTLPTVFLTRDMPWDPSRHDRILSTNAQWMSLQEHVSTSTHDGFNQVGEPIGIEAYTAIRVQAANVRPSILSQARRNAVFANDLNDVSESNVYDININPPDYESDRIYFLNVPQDVVRRTRIATTNFYQSVGANGTIRNSYRSRFPAANIERRNEPVATDTVYTDTPAYNGSQTCAQVFVGRRSRYIQIYGMNSDAQFVNTLNDVIRTSGAMDRLTNDVLKQRLAPRLRMSCAHI